jgi:hypothetical protein
VNGGDRPRGARGKAALLSIALLAALHSGIAYAAQVKDYFNRSHALVVGIDTYDVAGWIPLKRAEQDANAVADYLRGQGFEVTLLTNRSATHAAFTRYIEALAAKVQNDDRFLLYFGGHGYTEHRGGEEIGYIVPYGAASVADYISMTELRNSSAKLARAKHQLFILNSCFGGSLGILPRSAPPPAASTLQALLDQKAGGIARTFLSAGGADQVVRDDGSGSLSFFTGAMLDGLAGGAADLNRDGAIFYSELIGYLMPRAVNRDQSPSWGVLPGNRDGEFFFASARQIAPPATSEKMRQPAAGVVGSAEMTEMRRPIDELYAAWERLDYDAYRAQWDPAAVFYNDRRGTSLRYDERMARRRADFGGKYARVSVDDYQITFVGLSHGIAEFQAYYRMTFRRADGSSFREAERERYKTRRDPSSGRWRIVENRDYIRRR